MAKVKKEVKLGIDVVGKMIGDEQWNKVCNMISDKKLTGEAVRFTLDNLRCDDDILYAVASGDLYAFDEVFSSFEDYVHSRMAHRLFDLSDANAAFKWMTDFPSSSDELLRIYNRTPARYQACVFKNVIYRDRAYRLNGKLRDNYVNCFDAILKIAVSEGFGIAEAVTYLFSWAHYISKDWIDGAENIIGKSETVKLVGKRLDMRDSYFGKKDALMDLDVISEYLSKENPELLTRELLVALEPSNWRFPNPEKKDGMIEYVSHARKIYNKYLKPRVDSDIVDLYKNTSGIMASVHRCVYAYETDENILNNAFFYAIKLSGSETAIKEILRMEENNNGFMKPTAFMQEQSMLLARGFAETLLTDTLDTSKKILDFKNKYFPFVRYLDTFSENCFATKNIRLDKLSEKDLAELSEIINWDYIHKYFKDEVVPFEFFIKNKDKINNLSFVSGRMIGNYTGEQVMKIFKTFEGRLSVRATSMMADYVCNRTDGVSEADVASLLKEVEFIDIQKNVKQPKNSKLDVQTILTLI